MTATQKFIEDAIRGGWRGLFMDDDGITVDAMSGIAWGRTQTGLGRHLPLAVILLDPLAWQAVGQTRGWRTLKEDTNGLPEGHPKRIFNNGWRGQWMRFIDALADGDTIDEALSALE